MPAALTETLFPEVHFHPVDTGLENQAREHLDQLTKPKGSLGALEKVAQRLFAISGGRYPLRVDPAILYTVAADHGVAAQNVSAYPQVVTRQMVENYLNGGAAINVLCRANGINSVLVDAGCMGEPFPPRKNLMSRRIAQGTADFTQTWAMDRETCVTALRNGFALGQTAAQNGFACVGAGELGIANSTSATALYCALYHLNPGEIAGPGASAPPEMVAHKAHLVSIALRTNADAVNSKDPVAILAAFGGLEIATLAGLMLSCGAVRLPLVVDGFICTAAFAMAQAIWPPLRRYAFLAHMSAEPAYATVLAKLQPVQPPLLQLGMRLGEGTGAALGIVLLRSAAAIYNEMATFASAGVATRAAREAQ